MRIISGEARGRRLYAPKGDQTRPTSDKIRESIFNILGPSIRGKSVIDLFGGTGAMALEALSRGAKCATISDRARSAAAVIRRNAQAVLGSEEDARIQLLEMDYRLAIARADLGPYDFVFLDPPYRMTEAYATALALLEEQGKLAADWTGVLERDADQAVQLPDNYEVYDERRYGHTVVMFVREGR